MEKISNQSQQTRRNLLTYLCQWYRRILYQMDIVEIRRKSFVYVE